MKGGEYICQKKEKVKQATMIRYKRRERKRRGLIEIVKIKKEVKENDLRKKIDPRNRVYFLLRI